jgi:integrase
MGRRSTGTVRVLKNEQGRPQWHAKWTRADGTRTEYLPLDPSIRLDDEAGAKACAARLAPRVRQAIGSSSVAVTETVEAYANRWCEWREGRGLGCVADDRAALEKHVLSTIGALDVQTIGRNDLKRLVMALDKKARLGFSLDEGKGKRRPFGWKTALNAWSTVRALFRDARGAKDVSLCVRDDNPCDGVAGPDLGTKKAKTYLWPSEFATFVSCASAPLRWRRMVALAVYTYARAGELAALEWTDIDLEHGTMHIHRSLDVKRGRGIKSTKSDVARRVPIEPELLPLLKAMQPASKRGLVVSLPGEHLSRALRVYLRRAGIDRSDLLTSDATRKAITFHDLRATGVTWCAVRGDDPLKIMQRAGHADFETTKVYLREAENLAYGFGTPFPMLPEALQKNRPGIAPSDSEDDNEAILLRKLVEAPGIERELGKCARGWKTSRFVAFEERAHVRNYACVSLASFGRLWTAASKCQLAF